MIFFVFFQENLKICSGSNLTYRGLTFDFFLFSVHFLFKRQANSTIEQLKCEGHKKRDRLLISKVKFNFEISQRIKKFIY